MEDLRHKIEYLQENVSKHLVEDFRTQLRRHCDHSSDLFVTWVNIQSTYALMKNIRWMNTSIFEDSFTEFLHRDLGLSPATIQYFSSQALPSLRCLHPDSKRTNRDFLRYVFIVAASCPTEKEAITRLGLGRSLVDRLAKASEQLDKLPDGNIHTSEATFLPDVEEGFLDLLRELRTEQATTPWIVDLHKLGLILDSQDLRCEDSFSILRLIGSGTATNIQDISQKLSTESSIIEESLRILKEKNLVYVEKLHKKSTKIEWQLSGAGFDLTAKAFAYDYSCFDNESLKRLPLLPPAYQGPVAAKILAQKPDLSKTLDGAFLAQLAPAAANSIIDYMISLPDIDQAAAIGWETLDHSRSPLVRRSVLSALSQQSEHPKIRQLLQKVAESDGSQWVKEIAIDGLTKGRVLD